MVHNTDWLDETEPTQLDRIEAKLDKLLAPKKKRVVKPAGSKVVYWDFFNAVWSTYPKRAGNNPKNKAFAAFKARSNASDDKNINMIMAQGVNRYAAYCDATGAIGTGLVMHGATFFGPSDPPNYTLDWTIPKDKTVAPKKEHISATYKKFDPEKRGDADLDESQNPYKTEEQ